MSTSGNNDLLKNTIELYINEKYTEPLGKLLGSDAQGAGEGDHDDDDSLFITQNVVSEKQNRQDTDRNVSQEQYKEFVKMLTGSERPVLLYAYTSSGITRLISMVERYFHSDFHNKEAKTQYIQYNRMDVYLNKVETDPLLKLHKTVNVPILLISLVPSLDSKHFENTLMDMNFNKQV